MIEAMNTITNGNGYPIFMPNQVLKNKDLNSIISYLDSQNRLTRTHLIGMGIICGLEVKLSPELDEIEISAGCGITSEGFVIQYSPAIASAEANYGVFTHYQNLPLAKNLLIPSADKNESFMLQELILAEASGQNLRPLTELDDLDQRVVLVVYDWQDSARDSCLIDCDDLGQDRNFRLRFFLIDKYASESVTESNSEVLSAEKLLRAGFDLQLGQSLASAFQGWFDVPDCHIDRFGHTIKEGQEVVDLTTITDFDAFRAAYYRVCQAGILSLDVALRQTHQLFGPFISTFHPDSSVFDGLKDRLKEILIALVSVEIANQAPFPGDTPPYESTEIQVGYGIQYFYDYLVEMIAAFNELKNALFELMDDCPADRQRFPRYLLLGEVKSASEDFPRPSLFRHQFYQPPIYNGNQRRKQEVRHLYELLVRLSKHFTLLPFYQTPVKVTPSRSRQAILGEQAIPYYYWYPQIYPYWNYDACRKQQAAHLPAYFRLNGLPSQRGHDLIPRFDQSDFFRIEGHLGRTLEEARKDIEGFKEDFNLAFDLVAVRLGPKDAEGNLVLNGYFDDLELEFDQLKADWKRKKEKIFTEIENASLNQILRLMEENFLGKEDLSEIEPRLMENELLKLAKDDTNYEFRPEPEPPNTFILFLNQKGTRIGFVPGDQPNSPYLFELTDGEKVEDNKKQIRETFATCFSIRPVTFEVKIDGNVYRFSLKDGSENIELLGDDEDLTDIAIAIEDETPYNARTLIQRYADWDALYAFLQFFAARSENETEQQASELVPYYEFRALIHRYLYRMEIIKQLQSFTEYARKHRGLEHLGGVPKGGTFVLVYLGDSDQVNAIIAADLSLRSSSDSLVQDLTTEEIQLPPGRLLPGPERTAAIDSQRREHNIVVADFCLPYQCCSTYGSINYVMARPKPFICLSRTVFCENDENEYEFILDPLGGLLKGGDGIVDVDGQYAFQPSSVDADITEPTNLTFFYIVDGVGSSFSVLLLPVADASLSLPGSDSPFCITPGESKIINFNIATPGGTIYRSVDGGTPEPIKLGANSSYDLSTIPIPPSRNSIAVSFTYVIPSTDDYCGSTSDPVDITVIRHPQVEIAYDNDGEQAIGEVLHVDSCSDLRLRVNFWNALDDRADLYRWELPSDVIVFQEDISTGNAILDLVYNSELEKEIDLVATNQHPGTDLKCQVTDQVTVKLKQLDPGWNFPDSAKGSSWHFIEELTIFALCRDLPQIHDITIYVRQAGGDFSIQRGVFNEETGEIDLDSFDSTDDLSINLVDPNLPCEEQTQYKLDFTNAESFLDLVIYIITYSFPDDSSDFKYVTIVNVPPVGSFKIRLSEVVPGNNQFTLGFYEIEPPLNDFDRWKIEAGNRNPEFTEQGLDFHRFTYGENVSLGDTITATLFMYNSIPGICPSQSEPVSISSFFLLRLELWRGVRNLSALPVSWSFFRTLNDNNEIDIGQFRNAFLNIRAITFPENVGSVSVVFELTKIGGTLELPMITPDNNAPYDLFRDANDAQAAIWQPEVGTYTIKATPFIEADGNGVQGEPLELTFRLTDLSPDISEGSNILNSLINARLVNYRSQLEAMGQDNNSLRDSRIYERANSFLTIDASITEAEVMSEYEELTESLLRSYRVAGNELKASLPIVLALSTASLLDQLAAGTLTEDLINRLTNTFNKLREDELNLSFIRTTWNPEDLSDAIDVNLLNRLDGLLE